MKMVNKQDEPAHQVLLANYSIMDVTQFLWYLSPSRHVPPFNMAASLKSCSSKFLAFLHYFIARIGKRM